ncbi:hypothetical protein [Mycobacterium xenopi]|uniref:hypothetical protein n=1 Tax=Mycobacterium xenopi TaxID=1789 RepID=UPI0013896982|nr:hypothetical protein [Mycobacterium xenopi]
MVVGDVHRHDARVVDVGVEHHPRRVEVHTQRRCDLNVGAGRHVLVVRIQERRQRVTEQAALQVHQVSHRAVYDRARGARNPLVVLEIEAHRGDLQIPQQAFGLRVARQPQIHRRVQAVVGELLAHQFPAGVHAAVNRDPRRRVGERVGWHHTHRGGDHLHQIRQRQVLLHQQRAEPGAPIEIK